MTIPRNITRQHLDMAIEFINVNGVPTRRESTKFDLLINNKLYPPKYVIARANVYANGEELVHFSGGKETNGFLEKLGFMILYPNDNIDRNSYERVFYREEEPVEKFNIPALEPKTRSREYNDHSESFRDRIVYEYLYNGQTHRWLDEHILGLNPEESRGYQSMNILHYLGLKDKHKGLFSGIDINEAIKLLADSEVSDFSLIISVLDRLINKDTGINSDDEMPSHEDEKEYFEGKEAYRIHRFKERDPKLISDAKALFLKKHGALYCEACNINFEKIYGDRGKGFIEGHHTKPVSQLKEGEKTKVEDIAMLCPNCHRMIHRKPFISVADLRNLYHAGK